MVDQSDRHGPAEVRRDPVRAGLDEADLDPDPIRQFGRWFDEAVAAGLPDATAMTLATATPDGAPSARVVLLKDYDARGFGFYTNYDSQKGRELDANPRAALVFYWAALERQVRVTGAIERMTREESDRYFQSRPLGSRLGAWVSSQSEVIPGRATLEHRLAELAAAYPDGNVPLPPFWGGLRVVPATIEFWQGRPNRLHDRLRYTRRPDGTWLIQRLAP